MLHRFIWILLISQLPHSSINDFMSLYMLSCGVCESQVHTLFHHFDNSQRYVACAVWRPLQLYRACNQCCYYPYFGCVCRTAWPPWKCYVAPKCLNCCYIVCVRVLVWLLWTILQFYIVVPFDIQYWTNTKWVFKFV